MRVNDVDSAAWYDRNTHRYIDNTQAVDLSNIYERFLRYIPAGGRILDAGCGSGRDSLAFHRLGYDVVAMDASIEMVKHVSRLLGIEAIHRRHQDVDFVDAFDGVWSMASLLHVPHAELPAVLGKYRTALVPGGALFASFKHGTGERVSDERLFANQDDATFRRVLNQVPGLILLETSVDADRRPGRENDEWFSVICRRSDQG
jgi:2-polyprenyl-3-methyl-5-hydroxy-6-metoxy-1,4-benzoquinol methylase